MCRIVTHAILLLMLACACMVGCASVRGSAPETIAPSRADLFTPERFDESWKIIIGSYVRPLPDTPEARMACLQKLLASDLSSCLDDPHAHYMTKEVLDETLAMMEGSFGGVGLIVSQEDIPVVITEIMKDSPAENSGQFQIGDLIIEVNGKDVSRSPYNVVTAKIRGDADTDVTIRVQRDGALRNPVTLMRKEIVVESINAQDLDDQITYLRISDFNERTPIEFLFAVARRLVVELPDGQIGLDFNLAKFAFDLRGNPGGLVNAVAMMSYLFSPDPNQIILTISSRKREALLRVSDYAMNTLNIPPGVFNNLKAVILIDEKTASAAEIFAEFVHEATGYPRVGKKSYGKGSVQDIFRLSRGDALLFTIAEYFVGNQKTRIDNIGIQPEYEVDGPELMGNDLAPMQHVSPDYDPQLKKAIELLRALPN